MTEKINTKKVVDYWQDGAKKNFSTAKYLFAGKKYADCLFFCHLTLEKLLKAMVVNKTKTMAPYIHDLRRLAGIAGIKTDKNHGQALDEIFTFNIAGRYPEEKVDFYKTFNKKLIAEKYLKVTKSLILWLKKNSVKRQ